MQGIIRSGLGQGEYWINKINPIFMDKYNTKLFLGTLNIEVEKDYKILENYQIIKGFEYDGTEDVLIKECIIFAEKAFIVRAKRNNQENGDHPLNIIEIVSDVNFREKYKLKNNDKIEIYI